MTVEVLIERLRSMPPQAIVRAFGECCGGQCCPKITDIDLREDGVDHDGYEEVVLVPEGLHL